MHASSRLQHLKLLARYKAVFLAAWRSRHELAGPTRMADELAFLPPALSLHGGMNECGYKQPNFQIVTICRFFTGLIVMSEHSL